MITTAEKLKRISAVLKRKFMNLTVDETIDLAQKILEELERDA